MSARSFTLDKKRQGNITIVRSENGGIVVQLHGHSVAGKDETGAIFVNSCGWHTVTTKTAINRFLDLLGVNWGVTQKKGNWFLTDNKTTLEFKDGMRVPVSKLELALR